MSRGSTEMIDSKYWRLVWSADNESQCDPEAGSGVRSVLVNCEARRDDDDDIA